jgi:SAM-dependent methyltransferase
MTLNVNPLTDFYDARYRQGYMESWDSGKIRRVRELILGLGLPEKGTALDFGCGNGVFTRVIKDCLPGWEVYGTEISPTALSNAAARHPDCHFFPPEASLEYAARFDLIFSHHVLEHVEDLEATFRQLGSLSAEKATHLHILPCGNAGSYEYKLSTAVREGIETRKGHRFHFEEPGHLRRLTSMEFDQHMKVIGFMPKAHYFANQYWGAVNWITKSSPRFVRRLTDVGKATDKQTARRLKQARRFLLPLTLWQYPKYHRDMLLGKSTLTDKEQWLKWLLWPASLLSLLIWRPLEKKADEEWTAHKLDPSGSEMFLVYRR